jgi:hypothetical protein
MPTLATIDADARKRFVADCKQASAQNLLVHEYRAQRAATIAKWTTTIRALMDEHHVDDPLEILPAIIVSIEEHAIRDAKAAAEVAARTEIQRLLKKATAS